MGLSKELLYFMVYFKFHFLGDPPPQTGGFLFVSLPSRKDTPIWRIAGPILGTNALGKADFAGASRGLFPSSTPKNVETKQVRSN